MTSQHEIEALKARLMQTEGELAAMRRERNAVDIKAEVERRGGSDHAAIAKMLDQHTRRNTDGTLCAVDESGEFRYGQGHGCYMPVTEYLDELARTHPDLFPDKASAARTETSGRNPFAPGPGFNVTEQMMLLRNDPERAEHLQYVASLGRA